jgi:hypothetical protein
MQLQGTCETKVNPRNTQDDISFVPCMHVRSPLIFTWRASMQNLQQLASNHHMV